jgi:thiamine pyrophosphate-dependent acetolactate synthase large subunit-like protein
MMGSNALWTAARFHIPMLVIVANNRSYYNDETHQERMALVRGQLVIDSAPGRGTHIRARVPLRATTVLT